MVCHETGRVINFLQSLAGNPVIDLFDDEATSIVIEKPEEFDRFFNFLKNFHGSPTITTERPLIERLPSLEGGFEEHCHCNRGLRMTPNEKKYCPFHGYDFQGSTPTTKEEPQCQ